MNKIYLSVLALALYGCSTSNQYMGFSSSGRAFPEDCTVEVFSEGDEIRSKFKIIGDYAVLETGLSFGCSKHEVQENIRKQACAVGADAVQYYGIIEPSLLASTCYQIRARMLNRLSETQVKEK